MYMFNGDFAQRGLKFEPGTGSQLSTPNSDIFSYQMEEHLGMAELFLGLDLQFDHNQILLICSQSTHHHMRPNPDVDQGMRQKPSTPGPCSDVTGTLGPGLAPSLKQMAGCTSSSVSPTSGVEKGRACCLLSLPLTGEKERDGKPSTTRLGSPCLLSPPQSGSASGQHGCALGFSVASGGS